NVPGFRRWFIDNPMAFQHIFAPSIRGLVGYPSGQRGQTVNLLAYAFTGSNPVPTTTFLASSSVFKYQISNLKSRRRSHWRPHTPPTHSCEFASTCRAIA